MERKYLLLTSRAKYQMFLWNILAKEIFAYCFLALNQFVNSWLSFPRRGNKNYRHHFDLIMYTQIISNATKAYFCSDEHYLLTSTLSFDSFLFFLYHHCHSNFLLFILFFQTGILQTKNQIQYPNTSG